ncbi:hypothetical protein PAXRUDRAFT_372614 [Paxillus rubicundulus Ve08.2h10]|uniref:C2H2-type domain-containing protein n=1 Tax=Paxillus rubicundulus Ve08.2h10 TaxID=930991 RepID=A0A0D0E3R3_9AGAM|nr:hypothetical protein PAXRUDRAFT_372614 [Paxillus rubicundulus Ve08.2h10]
MNVFNQNWGVEEMVAFIGFAVDEVVQHCGWVHNGMVCNTPVRTKDFNAHLRTHHGVNSDTVHHQCLWYGCNAHPTTKAGLERHVNEQHIPGTWACPMCPETFTMKATLRTHLNERCPGTGY